MKDIVKEYNKKKRFVQELSHLFVKHKLYEVEALEYYVDSIIMDYDYNKITNYEEAVLIKFTNGFDVVANVTADSKIAILNDIIRRIEIVGY